MIKLQPAWKRKSVLDIVIIVGAIIVILIGVRVALGLDTTESPFYVVSSGSMIPTLNVNDVLIIQGGNFNEIQVGDIIVFHRPNIHDKIIVHRVIEINEVNGVRVVTTKGDANPSVIPGTDYPITDDDYIGKVIFVIPKLGYVTNIIPPPVNYIIVAIILVLIFMNTMKKNKKKSSDGNINKFDDSFDDDTKDDDKRKSEY